jgi:hypothetical protein
LNAARPADNRESGRCDRPPLLETGPAADRDTRHCFVGCGDRCRLFGAANHLLSGGHLKHGAGRLPHLADRFPLSPRVRRWRAILDKIETRRGSPCRSRRRGRQGRRACSWRRSGRDAKRAARLGRAVRSRGPIPSRCNARRSADFASLGGGGRLAGPSSTCSAWPSGPMCGSTGSAWCRRSTAARSSH